MFERNDLTPNYGKDDNYTKCECCNGTGFVYEFDNTEDDEQLEKVPCDKCDEGWILITD